MFSDIREELEKMSDIDYKKFIENLTPGAENILGVRTPDLRKISKKIKENENWKEYILNENIVYYEEMMLQGMLIGFIKDCEEMVKYAERFIPRINNWAVCDNFCTNLKIVKKNKEKIWKFLEKYFLSRKEYEVRFAVVISLKYFIEEEYLDKIFEKIDKLKNSEYYVQMGVAWAVAECFIKYNDKTLEYLKNNRLDDFTFNKTIQKICESERVDKEIKLYLKNLRI